MCKFSLFVISFYLVLIMLFGNSNTMTKNSINEETKEAFSHDLTLNLKFFMMKTFL